LRASGRHAHALARAAGQRDIAALSLALGPDFKGDRVAAFVIASADMLVTAHGGKTAFYLIDSLDAQYLYNAARNIEIAVWMLSTAAMPRASPAAGRRDQRARTQPELRARVRQDHRPARFAVGRRC
jgi:hypothetical protein